MSDVVHKVFGNERLFLRIIFNYLIVIELIVFIAFGISFA